MPRVLIIAGLIGGTFVATANFILYGWILPEVNETLQANERITPFMVNFRLLETLRDTLNWPLVRNAEPPCMSYLALVCCVCLLEHFLVYLGAARVGHPYRAEQQTPNLSTSCWRSAPFCPSSLSKGKPNRRASLTASLSVSDRLIESAPSLGISLAVAVGFSRHSGFESESPPI